MPIYETASDLKNENDVINYACARWGEKAAKLSRLYSFDYATMSGSDVTGFVEVKCRNLPFGYGDGYYLALSKLMLARTLMMTAPKLRKCLLLVRFEDGKIYQAVLGPVFRVVWHGREDRDDDLAFEPCGVIPWGSFKEI